MPDAYPGPSAADRVRARAARERARAIRAADIAAYHESLAAKADSVLRTLHRDMAEMHRSIARRHMASARMHSYHADRLAVWRDKSAEPAFMTAVASALNVQHVGISLLRGDRSEVVHLGSGPVAEAVPGVEFTIGEGPVHDVAMSGTALAADKHELWSRWPQFANGVARYGVHAVAAAPMRTDAACLGVLTVFDPPAEQERSATMMATVADALVYSSLLSPDSGDPLDLPLLVGADHHAVVHQASGMIAEQLGCAADDALVVLRARAFAKDRPLDAIAAEVVHSGLRLDR